MNRVLRPTRVRTGLRILRLKEMGTERREKKPALKFQAVAQKTAHNFGG